MADQLPQGLYDYLNNITEHKMFTEIRGWFPFLEPSHNTGYSPNVAYRTDSSINSLTLNDLSPGEGVINGELHIPTVSSGYVRQVKTNSDLQMYNLTFILWYKWEGTGTDDNYVLQYKGDGETKEDNAAYEIIIDGVTDLIRLRIQYSDIITSDITTSVVFPKDGNYHLLTIRRDGPDFQGYSDPDGPEYWCVSVDGAPETYYNYNFVNWDSLYGENSYFSVGGRQTSPRGFGKYKGIYVIDRKLSFKDVIYIASFGPPELTWFDYSNWDSVNNTGYVRWRAVGAPPYFKAFRYKLLNEVRLIWNASTGADNYILQRDTDPDFSSPIEIYSGSDISFADNITATGFYYYRVKAQIASIGIDSPWSESSVYIAVSHWEWNFGDGSPLSSIRNPSKIYTVGGVYSPSLRLYNDFFTDTYLKPDYIEVVDVIHEWDFGDGTPHSFDVNPVHIYTVPGVYDVTLKITTYNNSAEETYPLYVTATGETIVDFYGEPLWGSKRLTTAFTDTSIGAFSEWYWSFGDGKHSTERNPIHYYKYPGIFTVSLRVKNSNGYFVKEKKNYVVITSQVTDDIAPTLPMYLRGNGLVYKRDVGIEIKRIAGIE